MTTVWNRHIFKMPFMIFYEPNLPLWAFTADRNFVMGKLKFCSFLTDFDFVHHVPLN
jgi:lipopolysaccharide export system protein LptC